MVSLNLKKLSVFSVERFFWLNLLFQNKTFLRKITEVSELKTKNIKTKNGVVIAFVKFSMIKKTIDQQFRVLRKELYFGFIWLKMTSNSFLFRSLVNVSK